LIARGVVADALEQLSHGRVHRRGRALEELRDDEVALGDPGAAVEQARELQERPEVDGDELCSERLEGAPIPSEGRCRPLVTVELELRRDGEAPGSAEATRGPRAAGVGILWIVAVDDAGDD